MKAKQTFDDGFHVVLLALGQFATQRQATPTNPNSTNAANHALQRTATRVTLAAFHVRRRLVRSWRGHTSVAPFFAPPLQPSRRPPPSLSLGSLGDFARVISKQIRPN